MAKLWQFSYIKNQLSVAVLMLVNVVGGQYVDATENSYTSGYLSLSDWSPSQAISSAK